jgi:hypothetical protein
VWCGGNVVKKALPALQDTYSTQYHKKAKENHQGHQPLEPRPVHPTIIQKVRSVHMHQSWDREIEAVFQSQGHQTVK